MTPEMINAIAGLWPLALIMFVTAGLIIYRKEFRSTLARLTKLELRRGETAISLTQEAKPAATELVAGTAAQAEPEKPRDEKKEEALSNQPEDAGWIGQMIDAFFGGDIARGEEAYKKLQEGELSAAKQLKNEALYLYLQYQVGNETALRKLQDLAVRIHDMPEVFPYVQNFIGYFYEEAGNFDAAIERYESAAIKTLDASDKATYIVALSRCLHKAGKTRAAYERLGREVSVAKDPVLLSKLYEGLATLYGLDENHEMRAIAADKSIEYQPNNTSLLFDAAFAYSKCSLEGMALLLYEALLGFKPDNSMAMNNIAIAFKELGMVVKSATALKRAASLDNTLAAANLAYAYLREGFADEALEFLNKANKQKDAHQNVGVAFAALKGQIEHEDKLLSEAQKVARQQQMFLRSFAASYFAETPNIPSLGGVWKDEKGAEVAVSEEDGIVKAEWVGEKKLVLTSSRSNTALRIGSFVDKTNQYIDTKLADKGYGRICNDGNEIQILIIKDGKNSFRNLIRSDTQPS